MLDDNNGAHLSENCCVRQIEEHLNLSVPLTVVFEYPTIRELAAHILYLLNTPEMHPIGAVPDMDTGASLAALAEAAQAAAGGDAPLPSPLLSAADKAVGVACSPAQMYFVDLQQVCSLSQAGFWAFGVDVCHLVNGKHVPNLPASALHWGEYSKCR